MKKQAILLVHGMGKHAAPTQKKRGAFAQAFLDATSATLDQFAAHKGDSLENHFDIHELNYDKWFDEMRTKMAQNAKDMAKALAAVNKVHGLNIPAEFASTLTAWESRFGDDKFFFTHWLDVIFYGTLLGAKVRVDLALEITTLLGDYGSGNVHVVAHSLGTTVLHDTLQLLFRAESDPNDEIPDLDPDDNRLASIWMFANVSRLANSVTRLTDPLGSVVKPGQGGCTSAFVNVRHKLDPFTWLAQFNPKNDDSWVPGNIYASRYANIETELVFKDDPDPHSFSRYVRDPRVWTMMFDFLLEDKFKAKSSEISAATDGYAAQSLNGAYAVLESQLKNLPRTESPATWTEFLEIAKALREALKLIKDSF
jgi:hypothetical protein